MFCITLTINGFLIAWHISVCNYQRENRSEHFIIYNESFIIYHVLRFTCIWHAEYC